MNPFIALRDHAKEVYDTLSGNERIKERTRGLYDQVVNRGVKPSFPMLLKDPQNVTMDDLLASGFGVMPMTLKGVKPTQFSKAHETAQRNAALPVEQGGLGLPPDNTAMDRARAMGFDTDAYHSTNNDIISFDIEKSSPASAFGKGIYTSSKPDAGWIKNSDGGNIIPLLVNKKNNLPLAELSKENAKKLSAFLNRTVNEGASPPYYSLEKRGGDVSTGAKMAGFDSVDHSGPGSSGLNTVFNNPSQIRSRFAAFDPFKRNSADILATGIMGSLLLNELKNRNAQDKPRYR